MKARITNVKVTNDGDKTTIISDKEMDIKQALWLRLLAFKNFEDLDEIEAEATKINATGVLKAITKLKETLEDEDFLVEVEKYAEENPDDYGKGWGMSIKVRSEDSDDEKFNQDLNITIGGSEEY
jgi:hypothetical protein